MARKDGFGRSGPVSDIATTDLRCRTFVGIGREIAGRVKCRAFFGNASSAYGKAGDNVCQ